MDLKPVISSNIQAVGYDPESQTLHVQFKGGSTYAFAGVPPEHHSGLLDAESAGQYFHKHIRGGGYAATRADNE